MRDLRIEMFKVFDYNSNFKVKYFQFEVMGCLEFNTQVEMDFQCVLKIREIEFFFIFYDRFFKMFGENF